MRKQPVETAGFTYVVCSLSCNNLLLVVPEHSLHWAAPRSLRTSGQMPHDTDCSRARPPGAPGSAEGNVREPDTQSQAAGHPSSRQKRETAI